MELKPRNLKQITCEFVLFNRQHIKFSNRTIKRKITDFSGKEIILYAKKLSSEQELACFFDQIKAVYVDGKIVACRGCSELPLIVSNHVFSKMKARQKLLRESKIRYREMQKEETKKRKSVACKKYKRISA
ncbi:type III secretion system protein PrgR [Enterococcus faecium]|uniref:type III secretion system protein PrgR n=1 Tax=Enterococcus faecium TaxID=1352 RepID=UPI000F0B575A|nr:type III secretion system protein PrgR [Enterococcus faecium]MBY3646291.1 type III secretion system protein PrgR [Enterococcus faecium]MBY3648977.1 type III secretion system protein PrgR [Enterococcus faecium]MBY3666839.1 type III secretion system protein PrgR [Enterococcus faecium]MBY3680225.1 type III secretion system protein PrgR [Enterococcus faecium]HAP9014825.1 type III secretion system protein PrgR [Enterococcus faecium]